MISNLPNILARRGLLKQLVVSDLKESSANTKLGWLWWLLDPLIMMVIYWGVFSLLLGRDRIEYQPYPVFILCALVVWRHFSNSAQKSTGVLRSQGSLIKSVPFPTMVLPLSIVLTSFFYFCCGVIVVLVAAAIWRSPDHSGSYLPLIMLPLLMLFQLMIVAGVCLAISAIGVLFRDLRNITSHALRVGFYISPGLYGIDAVRNATTDRLGEDLGRIAYAVYFLNPFAPLISAYRDCIFYGEFVSGTTLLILAVQAGAILLIGNAIFQHYDRRIIKFL